MQRNPAARRGNASVGLHEPDTALLRGLGRGHELADGLQEAGNCLVVDDELALRARFKFIEPLREFLMAGVRFARFDESAHDIQTHFHRARGVEDGRRHQRAMLGEGERHGRGKLELLEVVTICDHLVAFGASELEDKIGGKAPAVA